jgi:signal transduction histidine kinase
MLRRKSLLLAFAFAGLLAIIGGAAIAIRRGSATEQREVAALHRAHLEAGDALSSIRANVFLAGILTRDYLLDPDASHAARYAEQFAGIRGQTERSFQILRTSSQSVEEKTALDRLHSEVGNYWDPTQIVLDWTPEEKAARRAGFLQDRIRHREEIVELAAQVERLMTVNFAAERSRITDADERFGTLLAWTTAIALMLALAIAAATVAHLIGLERQSAKAELELRRLSGHIRMAQEQERRFLSRELHDQAGQMLTGLRMELASISHDAGEEELAERVAHAKGIVEQTLRVIRNIAMLLRPSMLDDLGLAAAVGALVRDITRAGGMEVHAEIDPEVDSLPEAECTCAYRVVQEALTNAVRHSGARHVELSLTAGEGGVAGRIADDGRGFEMSPVRRNGQGLPGTAYGLGLAGMGERVHELGGVLRVISSPGRGSTIEFRLPRPDVADAVFASSGAAGPARVSGS